MLPLIEEFMKGTIVDMMMFNRYQAHKTIDSMRYRCQQISECINRLKKVIKDAELIYDKDTLTRLNILLDHLVEEYDDIRKMIYVLEYSDEIYKECSKNVLRIYDNALRPSAQYLSKMLSVRNECGHIEVPIKINLVRRNVLYEY